MEEVIRINSWGQSGILVASKRHLADMLIFFSIFIYWMPALFVRSKWRPMVFTRTLEMSLQRCDPSASA